MYRFVETYQGDLTGGCTRLSVRSMRHIPKVGKVKSVKGYTYYSTRRNFTTNHTAVALIGERGRIRFEGFCWGYHGEGPRGLQKLFDFLGLNCDAATICNPPTNEETKVHWSFDFDD